MKKTPTLFVLLPILIFTGFMGTMKPDFSFINVKVQTAPSNFQTPGENPVCVDCHSDLIESKNVHKPASDSCGTCHAVDIIDHSKNGARGLKLQKNVPALCFGCHKDIEEQFKVLKNVHKAVNVSKSCNNCHSPHSSDEKKLLQEEQKRLCLSCHDKEVSALGKKMINIKKLLETSKVIHPPAEKGCVVCHHPHGSTNNHNLISPFPTGNYAPAVRDTFALCWECHDSDLLEVEKTDAATNFRNGEQNLHFVHMNGKKSRSCVICHNVHASANEHLVEDKVKYGEWNLPIKYIPSAEGGSCFPGCHGIKTYAR